MLIHYSTFCGAEDPILKRFVALTKKNVSNYVCHYKNELNFTEFRDQTRPKIDRLEYFKIISASSFVFQYKDKLNFTHLGDRIKGRTH